MELAYCTDCGEARVSHGLSKYTDVIDYFFEILSKPLRPMTYLGEKVCSPIPYDKSLAYILELLARHGIGEIVYTYDQRDSIRTKALFESAQNLGIELAHYRLFRTHSHGTMIARFKGKTLVFSILPRPKKWVSASLGWMDDKGTLKRKLTEAGLPTAKGASCATEHAALATYAHLRAPVITKPHLGSRGRHTTLSITSTEELKRAFHIGKEISLFVVIEEEFSGMLYRVTLVGNKPVAVARRDQPHVIGDGVSTIKELITQANADPRRDGFSFFPLQENERMELQLVRQKLTRESVAEKGKFIVLNDKVSRLHGTTTVDVTDTVHPDNMQLFADLGTFLNDPVVGVDFMIDDITRSYKEQTRYGVVECNAMPYIDLHHYPFEGKPRYVAEDLWRLVFPETRV